MMLHFGVRQVLLLACTVNSVRANTNDHLTADLDAGTFEKPTALVRPRFRYWLPDLSVDERVIREDILSAATIGAGGVEFLPFYNAGGVLGGAPPGADWVKYGFGTPESNKRFI